MYNLEDWQLSIIASLQTGGKRISAIKMARYYTYLLGADIGLAAAKALVESLPALNITTIPVDIAMAVADSVSESQRATYYARYEYKKAKRGA